MEVAARSSDPDQNHVGTAVKNLKREWMGEKTQEHGPLLKKIESAFESSHSPSQSIATEPRQIDVWRWV